MWWLWIVIPAVILVTLFGLMVFIGSRLPREHQATRRAEYASSPDIVFQTITDFAQLPGWTGFVLTAERLPDQNGHAVWREKWGFGDIVDLEMVEFDPPRRFVSQIIHDGKRPFGGRWIHELSPTNGGCILAVTEDGWISNHLFRFMARYLFGYTSTIEKFLRALGKKFGQDVAVTP